MADGSERLRERVDVIEQKLDDVASSMRAGFEQIDQRFEQIDQRFEQIDQRFEQIDQRFEQVDDAFVEQRRYTDFAYESLVNRMDTGFAQLRGDIGRLERKLDRFIDVFQPKPPDPA